MTLQSLHRSPLLSLRSLLSPHSFACTSAPPVNSLRSARLTGLTHPADMGCPGGTCLIVPPARAMQGQTVVRLTWTPRLARNDALGTSTGQRSCALPRAPGPQECRGGSFNDASGATRPGPPWLGPWPWPRAGGSHGTQALVSLLVAERIQVDACASAGDEDAADAAASRASLVEGTPDPLRFRRLARAPAASRFLNALPFPRAALMKTSAAVRPTLRRL